MRSVPLAALSFLFAATAAGLVLRAPEPVAVAMVVAPLVIAIIFGLFLFTKEGGWRHSHGLKEWLFFGPVQAEPDRLVARVARTPAVLLCLLASVAVGALAAMLFSAAA